MHPLWKDYPVIQKELNETKNMIYQNIFIRNKQVNEAAKHIFEASGKMVRPAYALLFSQLGSTSQPERARVMAGAIEIFHNATLLHDDIIDEGEIRRGTPTIQAAYGKKSAVYAGDFLLSVCFRITHPYRLEMDVQGILTRAMERVIGGELHQLDQSFNEEMTLRRYLTQIRGKTAELFALACYAGAMESGLPEKEQWISYRIGIQIGMAFQLMDDLLEYTQDEADWGKAMFQDLKNGIYTAPVLFSMKQEPTFFKEQFAKEVYTQEDLITIRNVLIETKGIESAFKMAERYTDKALKLIQQLPDGSSKQDIERLTKTLLQRSV
ncbi:polyprenyl synthetase family protein [Marinilactibacillus kalidii]|uniref:polyprenyl synthetase family protein n=1 Tax=Marinilactibacillus kalidii TaxID=2820274 RepID=UPI001FC951FD|nr:polyprenyl synthetase family protein [Marinilactibacillus kalidii]